LYRVHILKDTKAKAAFKKIKIKNGNFVTPLVGILTEARKKFVLYLLTLPIIQYNKFM
jgi:hypothetical protein